MEHMTPVESMWSVTCVAVASLLWTSAAMALQDDTPHIVFIVGEGEYGSEKTMAAPGFGDIVSREEFARYRLHLDFLIPEEPDYIEGRVRGASGVYLGGRYEIEIVDSYGKEVDERSCGSIFCVRFANIWVQRLDYDGRTRELNFQG